MMRRDHPEAARQQIEPFALRLQTFAGMQDQERRSIAAFLQLQRNPSDADRSCHKLDFARRCGAAQGWVVKAAEDARSRRLVWTMGFAAAKPSDPAHAAVSSLTDSVMTPAWLADGSRIM
jgi:hypothetical protein